MERVHFRGYRLGADYEEWYEIEAPEAPQTNDYYFLSNDVYVDRWGRKTVEPHVFWGIANPHFFHMLAVSLQRKNIRRVIAVDSNLAQVRHFVRLYDLIVTSENRIDYLQKLFKVSFNDKAVDLLKNLPPDSVSKVRGGVAVDGLVGLEETLWGNCSFDAEAYGDTYGLNFSREPLGLRIRARTIGDLNDYYATFLCCSRSGYPVWPFTAGFGSGFLRDEAIFKSLQQALTSLPVYVIWGDITEAYKPIVYTNRYEPQICWTSNVFCDYFFEKHPPLLEMVRDLEKLGTQKEPHFPELDLVVLSDQRRRFPFSFKMKDTFWRKRTVSIHTRNFRRLALYLLGINNVEIVNVPEWIARDNGVSKLPNTHYMDFDMFVGCEKEYNFDSLILHILVGHGVSRETFKHVLLKAATMTTNLIILEHNRASADFRKKGIGMTIDEIRSVLGQETFLDFGPGKSSPDRNLIMVYRR